MTMTSRSIFCGCGTAYVPQSAERQPWYRRYAYEIVSVVSISCLVGATVAAAAIDLGCEGECSTGQGVAFAGAIVGGGGGLIGCLFSCVVPSMQVADSLGQASKEKRERRRKDVEAGVDESSPVSKKVKTYGTSPSTDDGGGGVGAGEGAKRELFPTFGDKMVVPSGRGGDDWHDGDL